MAGRRGGAVELKDGRADDVGKQAEKVQAEEKRRTEVLKARQKLVCPITCTALTHQAVFRSDHLRSHSITRC